MSDVQSQNQAPQPKSSFTDYPEADQRLIQSERDARKTPKDSTLDEDHDEPKAKPPLSTGMPPDEYTYRVQEDHNEAIDREEKAMEARHEAEVEALNKRHENDHKAVQARRERLNDELEAIHANVEMWQRHADERAHVSGAEHDAMVKRHDDEHIALARKTGFEVRRPTLGDTTIAGFPDLPLRGHPWVRPVPLSTGPGRLHPEL